MRWRNVRQSENVDDRRGRRVASKGLKLGGVGTVVMVLIGLAMGQDPMQILNTVLQQSQSVPTQTSSAPPQNDTSKQFISAVLASTEDVWTQEFKSRSARYQEPTLVLFSDQVNSACGMTSSATGPFYCPGDDQVYIDLSFFRELEAMGGVGDFARAYVLGHEIGHHIQNQLGISMAVQKARSKLSREEGNELSVKVELQADCYAGVWAHHADNRSNLLEEGDIQEGLATAAAIGDDQLMKRAGQRVRPDAFTHGSAKQRKKWFITGFKSGKMESCDTLPISL